MAALILYGLTAGVRSSRRLEEACLFRLDFRWLVSGRAIDHSTICKFRTMFKEELKDLFRQVCRVAIRMGLAQLNRIGLDGTRARANSSRHSMLTAAALERRLAELDALIEAEFAAAEAEEQGDRDLFGEASPSKLPSKLADLQGRRERLKKAFDKVRAMDAKAAGEAEKAKSAKQASAGETKKGKGEKKDKPRPARVPTADPDSAVMPNKDGGSAPNYTPVLTMDDGGYIVDAVVDNRPTEGDSTVATVERIEEAFGRRPKEVVGDGAYADGRELAGLEDRGVQAYVPVETAEGDDPDNPARRADPAQPVPPEDWPRLPRSKKGKRKTTLDRSAFVYDEADDCFYCPMGRVLNFQRPHRRTRPDGTVVQAKRYRCADCGGCPLRGDCLQTDSPRIIQVDEFEPVRRRVAAANKSTAGQEAYRRRSWMCETPFAFIKTWMHFRQFLLRGLGNVQTEWLWVCTAYNLRKLAADVLRLRGKVAKLAA
jgi:hypothetical protein